MCVWWWWRLLCPPNLDRLAGCRAIDWDVASRATVLPRGSLPPYVPTSLPPYFPTSLPLFVRACAHAHMHTCAHGVCVCVCVLHARCGVAWRGAARRGAAWRVCACACMHTRTHTVRMHAHTCSAFASRRSSHSCCSSIDKCMHPRVHAWAQLHTHMHM